MRCGASFPLIVLSAAVVGFAGARLSRLLAGAFGGLLATWVAFVRCFLWIFSGALFAITASVVGVIPNLALRFAIRTPFREIRAAGAGGFSIDLPVPASADPWAVLLAAAARVATFRFRVGMIPPLAGALAAGTALHAAGFAPT